MGLFERYLSLWVGFCIVAGIALVNIYSAFVCLHRKAGNLPRQPGRRRFDLGHDLSNDGANRFFINQEYRQKAARSATDHHCELVD